MKQRPTVTYVKNGKETTVNLNLLNKTKILKQIFENYDNPLLYINRDQRIKTDIKMVHFKNVELESTGIECLDRDTICILENCTLRNPNKDTIFKLRYGSFYIINPNLKNISKLDAKYGDDFHLTFKEERPQTNLSLSVVYQNICLEGFYNLDKLDLYGYEITLGSKISKTTLLLLNQSAYKINAIEEITLIDCIIENFIEFSRLRIDYPKINIDKKSCLKNNKNSVIYINDSYYYNENEFITLTYQELLKENLISILKGYRNHLTSQVEKQKQNYLKEEKSLNSLREQIATKEEQLKNLRHQLEIETKKKGNQIAKNLSKKRIKYFDKK